MASVELKGLGKRYDAAVAVDNVSLRIEHGQLVCLLGPSGCGKTTTLRLIAGFIEPSAGEIVVGGKVLSSAGRAVPPEGRNMSMIFQSYALWPHMTVAENVAYGLRIRRMDSGTIAAKLKAILSTARLEALADRYPGELSGGQQQRVSLARALVVEPETLLLDEPLSNLDANLREEMRFEIRRLHDQYRYTTVYVTHDQAEAMTTADLIAVMNLGRIEQLGTPQEIYDRPRSAFVARFIGGSNILTGKALDGGRVSVAGAALRTTGRTLTAGETVSVSVRQHDVAIAT
ncbi:MAG: ABC transporter ATP-binding protein, partial [Proteobacteria bacterium]|nr:ABC transporter ATP-binding protein [Pseudomonadota bacterium]